MGARAGRIVVAAALVYLLGLGILLIAPLRIVHYHDQIWLFTLRHLGLGWTAGRERALDAAVNAGVFLPLGFLGHRWWRAGSPPSWATGGLTLAATCLLAAGVEITQIFLPWRNASVADVVSDVTGAAVGVGLDVLLARVGLRARRGRP